AQHRQGAAWIGRPQPAEAHDTAEPAEDPDSQPTVPVALSGQRTSRPSDRRRLRDPDQATQAPQDKPDPWAREDGTDSERLRLTEIASRVEEEGEAPEKETSDEPVTATARAASGETPARPQTKRYSRSKRPSVPSWDEIMFGRRERSD
ncbi:MAG: hypothetical protein ACOCUN_03185, partial [Jiangellaceae bacterium]